MTTIKVCFFHRILIFVLIFLLPHPKIEQRSRREQEYEKERKKNYIVISLTFNIIKSIPSNGYTFTILLNGIDIPQIFPLIILTWFGENPAKGTELH